MGASIGYSKRFIARAERNTKNAAPLRILRIAWSLPHRWRRWPASAEPRSSSRLCNRLLVGRITTSVNGTTSRRSNPPSSQTVRPSNRQAMSAESEPIKASGACINCTSLVAGSPLRHRELGTTRDSCRLFDDVDVHRSTEENTVGECCHNLKNHSSLYNADCSAVSHLEGVDFQYYLISCILTASSIIKLYGTLWNEHRRLAAIEAF